MDVHIQLAGTVVRISYLRLGHGPPLVLLPGIGSLKEVWTPVFDQLSAHHDVVAVDLPGFGASGPMPLTVTSDVTTLTDAVAATACALDLARPHVAGNSLGGAIALEMARRGLVGSTTAIAPIGFWSWPETWYAVAVLRAARRIGGTLRRALPASMHRPRLRRWLLAPVLACGDHISAAAALQQVQAFLDADGFDRTLPNTRRYRYSGEQPASVTICWGTRDRLLPPNQARRAGRALPGARHVTLPGCGHLAMMDAPALVAEAILTTTRS